MRLLKLICITLILCLSHLFAFGQSNTFAGLKGGWLRSSLVGSDSESQQQKNGFNLGFTFNFSSANYLIGFQPEILFSKKGTSLEYLTIREEYSLSYLEVPLLFKLSVPNEVLRPNVFAGPYVALKLYENFEYTELITGTTIEGSNQLEGTDYGAVFGAGVDFDLEVLMITLDGRYNLGVNDLEKVETTEDIKNGSLSFNIGMLYRF